MAMEKGPYTPRRKYPWGTRRCGFSGSKLYMPYVESLENHNNVVDGAFYDAIKISQADIPGDVESYP